MRYLVRRRAVSNNSSPGQAEETEQGAIMTRASSGLLRQVISQRNIGHSGKHAYEMTYGEVPSVIHREENGNHGNFLPGSYRSICARPEWQKRLRKAYTAGKRVSRLWERQRYELDCANSSDALLMNVFCYPRILRRTGVCALLGTELDLLPEFGFRPRIPLRNGQFDRTEVDMRLGNLLVEAKLTESGFQSTSTSLLFRYPDLEEVFDVAALPINGNIVQCYQLIRGVLAAYHTDCCFLLLCDARRVDLIEKWFNIIRTVSNYSFRSRLKLLTWQELSRPLPTKLRQFLWEKYGIESIWS